MKKLRDVMRPGFLYVVQRGAPVRQAAQVMTANNVGIVLVLDGERLVGVFSERDVVRRVVDRGLDPDRTPV
ncbi:MAG: CBS domain-containing protein, partial [Candidatus Rokuibacteriota bacterium]